MSKHGDIHTNPIVVWIQKPQKSQHKGSKDVSKSQSLNTLLGI